VRRTITAIIPTFNEKEHITEAIASLAWCDSILVIDSYSTDGTQALARAAGANVVEHEYHGPAQQKNHAIGLVDTDWIIILDADERATPELQHEAEGILSQEKPNHTAYWIYRQNHFLGKQVKYSGWQSDKVIRLFKKDACLYEEKRVHEEMVCTHTVGVMRARLIHYTYKNLPHYMEKYDRYTTWSALDRQAKTPKVTLFHLWLKPSFRFFRHYIFKGGILDGKVGFIIAWLSAHSVFLRYLKIDRLNKGESL